MTYQSEDESENRLLEKSSPNENNIIESDHGDSKKPDNNQTKLMESNENKIEQIDDTNPAEKNDLSSKVAQLQAERDEAVRAKISVEREKQLFLENWNHKLSQVSLIYSLSAHCSIILFNFVGSKTICSYRI